MKVTYLESMGNDLSIVNAARCSFGKFKEDFDDADRKLLNFLAKNRHESPFAHTAVKFHFEAPIFVARQLAKHQIGFSWNEVSGRYVELEGHWKPDKWRKAASNVKQGSSEEVLVGCSAARVEEAFDVACEWTRVAYAIMSQEGVCREQARSVLPLATLTEWHWTGSLLGWARVWHLRTKKDAQQETRELVQQIDEPLGRLFPESWAVLKKWRPVMVEDEAV